QPDRGRRPVQPRVRAVLLPVGALPVPGGDGGREDDVSPAQAADAAEGTGTGDAGRVAGGDREAEAEGAGTAGGPLPGGGRGGGSVRGVGAGGASAEHADAATCPAAQAGPGAAADAPPRDASRPGPAFRPTVVAGADN